MKNIYKLDYPNISLKLFDYEDMTLSFNKDIWNLVIEYDKDEQCFFISNDEMNIYVGGKSGRPNDYEYFDIKELIECLKERIYGNVSLFYEAPDDSLTRAALDLKRMLRESITISYKGETK